ncbi:MAG: hypothetical protein RLY78_1912 [Pseudomonadota bacterium]|jgi:two-component system OmpR family response regulator|uniref:Winged helix-turn-helix domain-containing protein n=1 Tax=Pseudaquabacterium rugosum TaxID=2984194 RepID=A0ABU9BGU5_9BURK
MSACHHLLLAGADPTACQSLAVTLRARGHRVEWLDDVQRLLRADWPDPPDLLLLNLSIPLRPEHLGPAHGLDALALLRALRLHSALPVIVLTDVDDAADRVLALHSGADDCLSQPVVVGELLARIAAVLRRWRGHERRAPATVASLPLSAGAWRLCPLSRTLRRMNGPVVPLTPAEFRLMRAFFERPRHVLERSDLLALATEDEVAVDAAEASAGSRGVDLLVSRLRGKLGDDARAPRWIRTVRGRGYRFDVPEA